MRRGLLFTLFLIAPGAAAAGQTRCWIDKGALVAPAAFGDIAGDFLIDLSAPVSQLHDTRAQSDGIMADGVESPTVSRTLLLAGERVSNFQMTVVDLDARTGAFDTTINGVIGADLLSRFTIEIDPSPCRLRLSSKRFVPPRGAVRLAVSAPGGRPLAPATLSDGVHIRAGRLAIDTGHWSIKVAHGTLSRPLPAAGPAPPVRLRALEVGGRLFEQVPAVVEGDEIDAADGAIGMAVWSLWRLRLDMRGGWLYLITRKKEDSDPNPLSR